MTANYHTHPITGEPLAPIFTDRRGRVHWPIMGGSQPATEPTGTLTVTTPPSPPAPGPSTPPATPAPQPPAQPAAPSAPPVQPNQPASGQPNVGQPALEARDDDTAETLAARTGWPVDAARYVLSLRHENGSKRVNAKQAAADAAKAEVYQELGRQLGLVKDDEAKVTPEQLTAELTESRQTGRARAVELEVWRTAAEHGANPAALTDSQKFLRGVAELDPTAADFSAKVIAAAKAAQAANPSLASAPVVTRSGVEFNGGTGHSQRAANLEDAIAAKMGG